MCVELIPRKRITAFLVIADKECLCKSKRAGTPVLGSTGQFLNGYSSKFFLKHIILDGIPVGIQEACQSVHHICTEGLGSSFPCCNDQTDHMIEHVVAVFVMDGLKCGNGTDTARNRRWGDGKIVGFHQITDDKLLIITGLDVCHEYFIGQQGLYIFHLVCKNVGFMLIHEIIIDHTPYGSLS